MLTIMVLSAVFSNKPWAKKALLTAILTFATCVKVGDAQHNTKSPEQLKQIYGAHQYRGH